MRRATPNAPHEEHKQADGVVALVLGTVGTVLAFIPAMSVVGLILGIIAVVLVWRKWRSTRHIATASAVLGAAALVLGITFTGIYAPMFSDVSASVEEAIPRSPSPADEAPTRSEPERTTAPTLPTPSSTPTKAEPSTPAATVSETQALAAAESYLSMESGFSEFSLTKQLTSSYGNGFSEDDAAWAIAHAKPDWNAQAVMAAKGYLEMGGFSRSRLIGQLTSQYGNGFTQAQAGYAADKVGLK